MPPTPPARTGLTSSSPSRAVVHTVPKLSTPSEARAYFNELKNREATGRDSTNIFMYSFPGGGKTTLVGTARAPIVFYQFDPKGHESIRSEIENGRVILLDYSDNDPENPSSFRRWEKDFMEHKRSGLFDYAGSVAIDSLTTWLGAMQLQILKANDRTFRAGNVGLDHRKGGNAPTADKRDYGIQLSISVQYLAMFAALPCDSIVTAHAKEVIDEDTERSSYVPMLAGQQAAAIPLLFSEVWALDKRTVQVDGKSKVERIIRTDLSGKWTVARSRLNGRSGKLAAVESVMDIKALLKKVGRECEDLPYK